MSHLERAQAAAATAADRMKEGQDNYISWISQESLSTRAKKEMPKTKSSGKKSFCEDEEWLAKKIFSFYCKASSPACTELETIVMDWLGQMIGLPDDFLHAYTKSPGGGVIQTTASESTFVCLLAGRTEAIKR